MTMTPRSSLVTQGRDRAPNRGMLRALGMTDEDFTKPQIGIASATPQSDASHEPIDEPADAPEQVRRVVAVLAADALDRGPHPLR